MRWAKQYRAGERSFSDGTKEITSRSRIRWLSSVGTMCFYFITCLRPRVA